MAGSFLDTTIVVQLAEGATADRAKGQKTVLANHPAQAPFYALRELLAGHVRSLCDAHNVLLAAENAAEAQLALLRISPAEGRKKQGKLQAIALAMQTAFSQNPAGGRQDIKREMLQYLALRVNGLWKRAHALRGVQLVQSLGCFNDGRITFGPAGELRAPGDSFNCVKTERCAAAAYIYDNRASLTKLIDALHPANLDAKAVQKNENAKRRKALKELQTKGPTAFAKTRCRALGDAYFASMCPVDSIVLTTNIDDYLPLCRALGKKAKSP